MKEQCLGCKRFVEIRGWFRCDKCSSHIREDGSIDDVEVKRKRLTMRKLRGDAGLFDRFLLDLKEFKKMGNPPAVSFMMCYDDLLRERDYQLFNGTWFPTARDFLRSMCKWFNHLGREQDAREIINAFKETSLYKDTK